jgi:hypothetical protein
LGFRWDRESIRGETVIAQRHCRFHQHRRRTRTGRRQNAAMERRADSLVASGNGVALCYAADFLQPQWVAQFVLSPLESVEMTA